MLTKIIHIRRDSPSRKSNLEGMRQKISDKIFGKEVNEGSALGPNIGTAEVALGLDEFLKR